MGVDFFENGLCLHCNLAKHELMDFKHFDVETEKNWKKNDTKLQKEIEVILDKYPQEHHEDIIQSYSWDLYINQSKFPSIHRESLVITMYNFFEDQLNRLCEIFAESIECRLKLKDLHGQGIERAFLFLTKAVGIDFSTMGKEWPYIKSVNSLRNQIVHNGGILPSEVDNKLNQFVEKNTHLSGSAGNSVQLHDGFIQELITIQIEFFDKLDNEVQKFIQNTN